MGIKLVVAVTDGDWFASLRHRPDLTEVNFWAPSAANFRALEPGGLFLFKLHAPRNSIVGGGVFAYATTLPISLAWEAFGQGNGAPSLTDMRARVARYRKTGPGDRSNFEIGCRLLTQPFFFDEPKWIPVPSSWAPNIVSFKTYDTDESDGRALWDAVTERLKTAQIADQPESPRFGAPTLVKPRLGQGAFRVLITDAYGRRCAITRERTLPALEAAHIRPYSEGGSHDPGNGLLLRRDIHSLFDSGYVTVAPDLRFIVSAKIREEFENGKDYYRLHGSPITQPDIPRYQPNRDMLVWHNETCFRG